MTLSIEDPEVRKEVKSYTNSVNLQESSTLGVEGFKSFSPWSSLRCAIAVLILKVRLFKQRNTNIKDPQPKQSLSPKVLNQAINAIIKAVQKEAFKEEFDVIIHATPENNNDRISVKARNKSLKKSSLYQLDPYVDDDGILRVGGRLCQSNLSFKEKHPVLLPKKYRVSKLLLEHYHEEVHHKGCQITHGSLRDAAYWLVSGHAAVASLIGQCVTYKKLRGPMLEQQMADLPPDKAEVGPP